MMNSSPSLLSTSPRHWHGITASDALTLEHDFSSSKGARVFNDPVHGHIELPFECMKFVDTPQFQRLRELKQLGTTYLLFPGGVHSMVSITNHNGNIVTASHNRFEHCIGVSHLARTWVRELQQREGGTIAVSQSGRADPETQREVRLAAIAGLCHDIGHGPFSHSFEHWASTRPSAATKWHHEDMSVKLLSHTIDSNAIEIEKEDIGVIEALIKGDPSHGGVPLYLYDVVANGRNSVDVDKFDYLQVFNVYEMFHTRYSLFKQVYTHRVGQALEFMLHDIFTMADPVLQISEDMMDPERFTYLTDSILKEIERSRDPLLKDAQRLIHQIRTRNLYRIADEVLIPPDNSSFFRQKSTTEMAREIAITAREMMGSSSSSSTLQLNDSDVVLQYRCLNYAMADRNPVDSVHFYSRFTCREGAAPSSFTIPKSQVSLLIPDQFSEHYMRVFSKNSDKQVVKIVQRAFRQWLRQFRGLSLQFHPAHRIPSPVPLSSSNNGFSVASVDTSLDSTMMMNMRSSSMSPPLTSTPPIPAPSPSLSYASHGVLRGELDDQQLDDNGSGGVYQSLSRGLVDITPMSARQTKKE